MAIGIFGGTFNPPHLGHKRFVQSMADKTELDKVLIIPTSEPPHKQADNDTSCDDRVEMCRRMFTDDRCTVSTIEIDRGGKSYTVETLEELKKIYPEEKLYFLLGSDMILSFDKWYRYEDILKLCTLCAATREKGLKLPDDNCIVVDDFDPIEISSTEIREKVRLGEDVSELVGKEVASFIAEKKLYHDGNTRYRQLLRDRLSAYRLHHSFCVADCAKELAGRYGYDCEKAYTVGLLHDVMKDSPKSEQLQAIEKAGIILTDEELHNPKLWHTIAGYAYLKNEKLISDEDSLNAVRYHTTGRRGMSLLEKIIYIADFASADRTYNGIEKMRTLSEQSLEEAMYFGLTFTISDLCEKGGLIHPDSIGCYNEIVINRMKGREQ